MKKRIMSIPTKYNGIKFRSRLEAKTAFLFDALSWNWEYEPQSFLLRNGKHYWPDFFLPDLKVWVECKGDDRFLAFVKSAMRKSWTDLLTEENADRYEKNLRSIRPWEYKTFLVISKKNSFYFDCLLGDVSFECTDPALSKCPECGSFTIFGQSSAYNCKTCGYWPNGDDLGHRCISFHWLFSNINDCTMDGKLVWDGVDPGHRIMRIL
jgi:hypothetical protein